jgi:hypothetical protein
MKQIIIKMCVVAIIVLSSGSLHAMGMLPEESPESNAELSFTAQELGAQLLAEIIANLPDSQFRGNLTQLLETGYMTIIDNEELGITVEMGINWSYTKPGLIFNYSFSHFKLLDGTIVSGSSEALIVCGFKNLLLSTLDIVVNTVAEAPMTIENGELEGTIVAFDDAMVSFDIRNLAAKGFVDESYGVSGKAIITPFGLAAEETNIDIDQLMGFLDDLKAR